MATPYRLTFLLACSSGLAVLFWMIRLWHAREITFIFLNWNLFLAWIPFVSIRAMAFVPSRSSYLPLRGFLMGICFFFLPNAPYIITDLIHLKWNDDPFIWFDALLIFSYAWTGLLLFLATFNEISLRLQTKLPTIAVQGILLSLAMLCGYGIYLGRFIRLNSWDVIRHPESLVSLTLERILDPFAHPRTVGVTLFFGLFLWLGFHTVQALRGEGK